MNSTSTPSMVELHSCSSTTTSPPPLLQPPPPSLAPTPPPTSPGDPVTSPSPLLRDVGSVNIVTAPSQARMLPQPPLPFPEGCGRLTIARRRNRGRRKMREDPESGRPRWYITKTNHDFGRSSFPPIPLSHSTDLKPTTTATVANKQNPKTTIRTQPRRKGPNNGD